MKKNLSAAAVLMFSAAVYSQVGINTQAPKATLDIIAKNTNGTTAEGMIAPRLTGNQIQSADALYGADQRGAIVYITSPVTSSSTKTANITSEGYYYFNGSLWQNMGISGSPATTWTLSGNSGTNPATNFIGTTGSGEHMVFKTAGRRSGLIMDGASGSSNTAFGWNALNLDANNYTSSSVNYNTAFGARALGSNTGQGNTAVGTYAARDLTSGQSNIAIGYGSLSTSTTGSYNVSIGVSNLLASTVGQQNTSIGSFAGNTITTGSRNIIIGSEQNVVSATGSNQLNIGGAIFGTGLSGSVTAPAGNIGIGTTSPASKLEVNGSVTNTSSFDAGSSTTIDFSRSNLAFTSASAGNFTLQNIKDGGSYTLSVRGVVAGTSVFTATGFTFKYVNNNPTVANTDTLYSFVAIGSIVYVYCVRGL